MLTILLCSQSGKPVLGHSMPTNFEQQSDMFEVINTVPVKTVVPVRTAAVN